MTTNEERREVAARLRDIGVKTWHTSWHEMYAIKNACGCYTGQDQQDVELKDRLAELIEPEEHTCQQVLTECNDGLMPPFTAHCSKCGAKVVEE